MLGKMPKMCSKSKMKMVNESEFDEFLSRISKTLYYGDEIMVEDHLSYPVIELAAEIYSDLKTGKSIDRLYLDEATEMTQKVKVNPCYMVLALLYIERLKDCNTEYLDNIAPSQLFLISLVLASKFHDDSEYELSLSMFDKFSDFSRSDIFQLEMAFLSALQWKVSVSEEEFCGKLLQMEKLLAMKNANRRNWFTYTEMSTLLLDEAWTSQLTSLLVVVSAVCFTTYTAGVLTLLASSVLASHISSNAALVILSTTAQLSLLVPSCGTSPPSNGTNSITSLPTDSIEETLEQEILDGFLDETALEDLISRMNFGNDCNSIRNKKGFVSGWKTHNCIRNMETGDFWNTQNIGSNPNIFSTLDNNWNVRNMIVQSRQNKFGLFGVNDGNMLLTNGIRNIAWKPKDSGFQFWNDGRKTSENNVENNLDRKTSENNVENDLKQYVSNADHTSIRMSLNSKRMPSKQQRLDSKLNDIPKAELTLHSLIDLSRSHSILKEDYHALSTMDNIGIDSKPNSQMTCIEDNSMVNSNQLLSQHCSENSHLVKYRKNFQSWWNDGEKITEKSVEIFRNSPLVKNNAVQSCNDEGKNTEKSDENFRNSPLMVLQRKDNCRYNQNDSNVNGAFFVEKFHPDYNNVYEPYEENMLNHIPCKRILGRDRLEKNADSSQYDVISRQGYGESTEYDAELDHGYADSTLSYADSTHGYIESSLNVPELDHGYADSTRYSFIPLSFSHSIPLLSSLSEFSISDYLPPLKNISSLLLNQINNDLFSPDFKFDTSESTTDIVDNRYRFESIDSYYRTGAVYRRENEVEILSC